MRKDIPKSLNNYNNCPLPTSCSDEQCGMNSGYHDALLLEVQIMRTLCTTVLLTKFKLKRIHENIVLLCNYQECLKVQVHKINQLICLQLFTDLYFIFSIRIFNDSNVRNARKSNYVCYCQHSI